MPKSDESFKTLSVIADNLRIQNLDSYRWEISVYENYARDCSVVRLKDKVEHRVYERDVTYADSSCYWEVMEWVSVVTKSKVLLDGYGDEDAQSWRIKVTDGVLSHKESSRVEPSEPVEVEPGLRRITLED